MFFCVSEIGGVMGPVIVGALVDSTGTFFAGIFFLAALCQIILAVTFLLRTPVASAKECSGE
jgi:cyanate permease